MLRRALAWITASALGIGAMAYGAACVSNDTTVDPCPKYCSDIQATCTGQNQQFPDVPTCTRFCAALPPGEAGVTAGDTVACRELSVSNAKDDPSPTNVHAECVGGGVTGFDGPTTCAASACAAFCNLDLALCGTQRTGYADVSDCEAKCAQWGQSFDGPLLGSTGNTLQCRVYHLELSQTGDPADLETHCPHTADVSARCFDSDAGADAGTDGGATDAGAVDASTDAAAD